jgi:uncharacterized RDD family membrane protein YckC
MKPENINQLANWLRANPNYSLEQLRQIALQNGYSEAEFNAAINLINPGAVNPVPAAPPYYQNPPNYGQTQNYGAQPSPQGYYNPSTPQLEYKGNGIRFWAWLVDTIVFAIALVIFSMLFGGSQAGECNAEAQIGLTLTVNNVVTFYGLCGFPALLYFLAVFAYYVFLEWTLGGTLGKLATGIKVVKVTGEPLDFLGSIIRNIIRIIDGIPFLLPYLVGAILVCTSSKRQRLGDRLAKTVVVSRR